MKISADGTYELLKKALDASYMRQQAISNNVANINTPNYKADRVVFEEELKKSMSVSNVSLRATHDNHIGLQDDGKAEPRLIKDQSPAMKNDGNNVDIDMEMTNLAANQILYSALVQQTNQKISTLRNVISGGKG